MDLLFQTEIEVMCISVGKMCSSFIISLLSISRWIDDLDTESNDEWNNEIVPTYQKIVFKLFVTI